MGRPLSKAILSNLQLSNAYIPGDSGPTTTAVILAQKGTNKYLVRDILTQNTGIVSLQNTVVNPGDAVLTATIYGGGHTNVRKLLRHQFVDYNDAIWEWNPQADLSSQVGGALLPFANFPLQITAD